MQCFQITDVFPDQGRAVAAAPPCGLAIRSRKERFGKATQPQQIAQDSGACRGAWVHHACRKLVERRKRAHDPRGLGQGEGVQVMQEIPSLQRVAPAMVDIQARAAGHQDAMARPVQIELPLEPIAPRLLLVQFIEDPQMLVLRQRPLAQRPAMGIHVPAEVRTPFVGQDLVRQGGLATLPGPDQKDHLRTQILHNGWGLGALYLFRHGSRLVRTKFDRYRNWYSLCGWKPRVVPSEFFRQAALVFARVVREGGKWAW